MPMLISATAMSWRRPRTDSIRIVEPARPRRTATPRLRVSAPGATGSRRPERSAISSSVRIAVLAFSRIAGMQALAQGFQGAVHRHLHRRFRHAGALCGLGHRNAVQLDVRNQLALGGGKPVKELADIA